MAHELTDAGRPLGTSARLRRGCGLAAGLLVALVGRDVSALAPDETAGPSRSRAVVALPLWDTIAGGLDLGLDFGVNLQAGMITTRFVRITILDAHLGFAMVPRVDLTWHLGPVIGFGGHVGSERRLSHWLMTGIWVGGRHSARVLVANSSRLGLFLPIGYELRYRYRNDRSRFWGIRVYAAFSPLSRETIGEDPCRHDGSLELFCGPGPPMVPYYLGLSVFFGM